MPQSAPNAQTVSYSGPSPSLVFVRVIRVQAMGQDQQALFLTSNRSLIASPDISSAWSKTDSWKLRVGSAPITFITFMMAAVPNCGSA